MNWLENSEKNSDAKERDTVVFQANLAVVLNVVARIKKVNLFSVSSDLLGNGYECKNRECRKEQERIGNDLHFTSYDRLLSIMHSVNSNVIELLEKKYGSVNYNVYDASESKWQARTPSSIAKFFEKRLTDAELKNLNEEDWIKILGWLFNKTTLHEVHSVLNNP